MYPNTHIGPGQRPGCGFNALKHGHYAQSILLPGESAAEFQEHRRELFHEFRPQTKTEAKCVHVMAECQWEALRYGPLQAQFDGQIVAPATDAAGRISEPLGHRRLHSTIDVSVIRRRIQLLEHKEHARLMTCQKQRLHGLVAGARKLPKDCYLEMDGQIIGPVVQEPIVPVPEAEIETDRVDVSDRNDRGVGFREEPKEMGEVAALEVTPQVFPRIEANLPLAAEVQPATLEQRDAQLPVEGSGRLFLRLADGPVVVTERRGTLFHNFDMPAPDTLAQMTWVGSA